ncbi:MAG TPA: hypothetical protein PK239_06705 [Chitinophagales bacterium]|nr:hypothetical protein [Chitinophagales bacterium]HRK26967.1 hypothetical protein [Chitinophagales bacterium]
MRYNQQTLDTLENLLKEGGYKLRTGKGSFNSGYCILQDKKVVVLNKYHSLEARINSLIEIIKELSFNVQTLPDELQDWYHKITKPAK